MSKRLELIKKLEGMIEEDLYYTFFKYSSGEGEPEQYQVKGSDLSLTEAQILLANLEVGIEPIGSKDKI